MTMMEAKDWKDIDRAISAGDIPAFPTKSAAMKTARDFGWSVVTRFKRRFETVWLVGKVDFQPTYERDLAFDVFRAPILKWVKGVAGAEACPVVKFRKPKSF